MTVAEIEDYFPAAKGRCSVTSPADEEYNCIAWSVNDKRRWWWPNPPGQSRWPGKYWPEGIPHEETIAAFKALYRELLFEECDSVEVEPGYDKIAIFADKSGTVTHAARLWLEDSGWSSKLGQENDIHHHSLNALEGTDYGYVVQVMRRMRKKA